MPHLEDPNKIIDESFLFPGLGRSLHQEDPWYDPLHFNGNQDNSWVDNYTPGTSSLDPWVHKEPDSTQETAQPDLGWDFPIWPIGAAVSNGSGQAEAGPATEASLEEARLLLASCLRNGDCSADGEKTDSMASRLEPVTIDRENGELARNVNKLYSSS